MIEIFSNYQISGRLKKIEPTLRRKISQFNRTYRWLKIGITSDIKQRANYHNLEEWEYLIVLWKTSSENHVRVAEKNLIDWCYTRGIELDNVISGGGGAYPRYPKFQYLYLLLKK